MTEAERQRFDALAEAVFESLPANLQRLLEEIPVVIDDVPSDDVLTSLGFDPADPDIRRELCGLNSGTAITEQSIEAPDFLPTEIQLYRVGIIEEAGGWDGPDADARVTEELRITILHEIGHHFGLDEDDLADLGYD